MRRTFGIAWRFELGEGSLPVPGQAEAAVKVISSPWVTAMCQCPLGAVFPWMSREGALGQEQLGAFTFPAQQSSSSMGINPGGMRTQRWLHSVPGDSHQLQTASGHADPFFCAAAPALSPSLVLIWKYG